MDVSLNPVNSVLCLKLGNPISVKLSAGGQAFVIGSAVRAGFLPANKFDALGNASRQQACKWSARFLADRWLLALLKAFNLLLVKKRACRLKNFMSKKTPDFKGRIVAKIHGESLEIRDK